METLILRNGTAENIQLLLAISKKLGIDVELVSTKKKQKTAKEAVVALAKKRNSTQITQQEIIEECNQVRKEIYER